MLFDLVLVDEMRDIGRIVDRSFAAPVDGAVYEELDALPDGLVDQRDALAPFVVVSGIGGLLSGFYQLLVSPLAARWSHLAYLT